MIYHKDDEIIIREMIKEDAPIYFAWNLDKEIHQYDPFPRPENSKELLVACEKFCNAFDKVVLEKNSITKKFNRFWITNAKEQSIGFVTVFNIDTVKNEAELGIVIGDKRYWKKGIAFKAIKVVEDHVFSNYGLKRIYIETSPENIPAQKLFEKLNYSRCGNYDDEGFIWLVMEKFKI